MLEQWQCLPLTDNYPTDEHGYELHVFTGFKSHAETNSKVHFKLSGTDGSTGVRAMDDGCRQVGSMVYTSSMRIFTYHLAILPPALQSASFVKMFYLMMYPMWPLYVCVLKSGR